MADVWVCANCRSVNKPRAKQCYQCRTPKGVAAVDPLAISSTTHGEVRAVELPRFRSSRGIALIASVAILGRAAFDVAQVLLVSAVMVGLVDESQALTVDPLTAMRFFLGVIVAGLLALLTWSFWLSSVVRAMPALGLGYPAATGFTAFYENFIPILNLWRVPAILRDVVHRLEPHPARGDALIFAAWIGLVGGIVVSVLGSVLLVGAQTPGQLVRNSILIQSVSTGLVVAGSVFGVALIWWIEVRIWRRRRAQSAETAARPSTIVPAPAADPRPATGTTAARHSPLTEQRSEAPLAVPSETPPRPADAVPASWPDPAPAPPPFVLGPAPAILADVEPRPSTGAGGGPRLAVTVQADGRVTAELEGESETVTLDDVREAAAALAKAGGSAIVTVLGEAADARWTAREAARALRDQGVPTTFQDD